jgi:hypothetical protein
VHIGIAAELLEIRGFRRALLFIESLALDLPGSFDSGLNVCRGLSNAVIAYFIIINPGHLDMDVDTVLQGVRNVFLVLSDGEGNRHSREPPP